jgi:very-short-patch-repair endonuclease
MHLVDVVADELAALQCGTFGRWQLLARGVERTAIRRRLTSGRWVHHGPGVYGLPSHAPSFDQRLWIAWLAVGPDAVVSHEAAAQLHDLPGVERGRLTLIAPHATHHRVQGAFVHQIDDVEPGHRTGVRGLPTTTVPRTVVDLAGWVGMARLLRITEGAKHARLTTYEDIGAVLAAVARRGKPGVGRLARALDMLNGRGGLEQSVLERALLVLLKRHRLPPPIPQMAHPGRSLPASCVDAGYPEAKLIIEADGRRWHTRVADVKRDRERDAEAARNGWLTLRLLHEHIVDDPDGTAKLVRDVLATRLVPAAS